MAKKILAEFLNFNNFGKAFFTKRQTTIKNLLVLEEKKCL